MIADAKTRAAQEAALQLEQAREAIRNEKMQAMTDLRNQVAALSIEIAERVLKAELSQSDRQKAVVDEAIKDITLN
jgi:F-type H+-transporting ATPase subunit b